MSIPSSPSSNRHRRHPSSLDLTPSTYTDNAYYYPQTPQSPNPWGLRPENAGQTLNGERRMSEDYMSNVGDGGGGGLGNLADELADAWADEDGYEDASGIEVGQPPADGDSTAGDDEPGGRRRTGEGNDEEGDVSQDEQEQHNNRLSLPRPKSMHLQHRHRRTESQYDGSDYGNDSDLEEAADIPPSLEARMAAIESLARRGTGDVPGANDQVTNRLIESLQNLGAQTGIENGAARLITAHASITSHLTHQTRAIQALIHPLLFSQFPLLTPEAIDDLIPMIDEGLLPSLPVPFPTAQQQQQQQQPASPTPSSPPTSPSFRPTSSSSSTSKAHNNNNSSATTDPLTSLQSLLTQTDDLTLALRTLSDTLHESRQLTSTASRRLRSARDLVAELRREDQDREEGLRFIERGEWDRRLREREAGRVCGEVVSGFEQVCCEWRRKLFGSAGEVTA